MPITNKTKTKRAIASLHKCLHRYQRVTFARIAQRIRGLLFYGLLWIAAGVVAWVSLSVIGSRAIAAAIPSSTLIPDYARPALTLELLEERLAHPVSKGGMRVVDLTQVTIDLRQLDSSQSEKAAPKGQEKKRQLNYKRSQNESVESAFTKQFYQQLQAKLNASPPLGLDLSRALIKGNLDLSRLSLRVSPYGGPVIPGLETFNQSFQPLLSQASPTQLSLSDPYTKASRLNALLSPSLAPSAGSTLSRSFLMSPQSLAADTLVFQGSLRLSQTCFSGLLTGESLYFLGPVEALGAIFTQPVSWRGARFARRVEFSQSQFQQESSFQGALFAGRTGFNEVSFSGPAQWQGATFAKATSFARASFQTADFSRSHWQTNADFDQSAFHGPVTFQKSRFDQSLFLTGSQFDTAANFRQSQFQSSISLRGAHILSQLDFGDARFAPATTINVADLDFNPPEAALLGSPGYIGKVLSVPVLASNETVLRNLVRNFRLLEQVVDANQVEFTTERLRLKRLERQIFGLGLNQANAYQLVRLGLNSVQANAVVDYAAKRPFVNRTDLLNLDEIDLASYLKVRDRLTVRPTRFIDRIYRGIRWLLLAGLLLLSQYGTNVTLTFGVGLLATAAFAVIFWLADRFRRRLPTPIVPAQEEIIFIAAGTTGLAGLALLMIAPGNLHPAWTLLAVASLVVPVPALLLGRLYQQGRYHNLMERSYFVENGALRKLQVLIARLPIVPKFPFYRERYTPLPIDKRWNWLNYFDFSLNNWFKFGFNDIRLRDREVPGLISTLVWYQWSLGVAYIALLLWTLSRTIPGLNLLLYF